MNKKSQVIMKYLFSCIMDLLSVKSLTLDIREHSYFCAFV